MNFIDFKQLTPPGTRLAARLGVAVCMGTMAGACLVTDKPEFGERNVAPQVTRIKPAAFSRLNLELDPVCAARGMGDDQEPQAAFTVGITDVNEDDTIEVLITVNGREQGSATVKAGPAKRDPVTLCIEHSVLDAECNYVVVGASSSFTFSGSDDTFATELPDDLGTVDFFVLGAASQAPQASPEQCARLLERDAGAL